MHVKPILLDCNFTVDADDTDGYGITDLKGPCIAQVYMNSTAATPAKTVAAGTILVQLSDNYSGLFNAVRASIGSALSGSDLAITSGTLTAGVAYTITVLGTSTTGDWHTIGVPAGITPAVGVSFIAATTGTGSGSGKVQVTATSSTVASIELVGGGAALAPNPNSNQGYGGQLIFQCYDYAGAKVAPAEGSIIYLQFYLSDSSIQIGGE